MTVHGRPSPARAATPFVDFYRANGISPVAQNIDDLARHYGRRASLYRLLGLPPALLRGRALLELCPGSGYNALYTQSLEPASYVLVDGNPTGLDRAKALFARYHPRATNVVFHLSLVEAFATPERFDAVFCEGAIPFQLDPPAFAAGLVRFVAPGGALVVTCIDAVSFMGEALRRVLALRYAPVDATPAERLERLRGPLAPHLASLPGASRPLDDWILDNVVHPYEGRFFSIADAIDALGPLGMTFYGASPQYRREWRWYKDLTPGEEAWNADARERYEEIVLNLLDCRYVRPARDAAYGRGLLARCQELWDRLRAHETGAEASLSPCLDALDAVIEHVAAPAPETAASLRELAELMRLPAGEERPLPTFTGFFGRGTQYVSFLRDGATAP